MPPVGVKVSVAGAGLPLVTVPLLPLKPDSEATTWFRAAQIEDRTRGELHGSRDRQGALRGTLVLVRRGLTWPAVSAVLKKLTLSMPP